jgi:hypothetical protein
MSQSTESRNKALVLEAFDTLFNKRDYAAAERFWSSNYVQHSAHIEPGREGLFNLIKGSPMSLRYQQVWSWPKVTSSSSMDGSRDSDSRGTGSPLTLCESSTVCWPNTGT